MFTPNLVGQVQRKGGFDVHGRPQLSAPTSILFAVVNARRTVDKTTVRADSSASRGSADEITSGLARILVAKNEQIAIGDVFSFDGDTYDVKSIHRRRSVTGELDHFECDLEVQAK
jgi:hypothetical protein